MLKCFIKLQGKGKISVRKLRFLIYFLIKFMPNSLTLLIKKYTIVAVTAASENFRRADLSLLKNQELFHERI